VKGIEPGNQMKEKSPAVKGIERKSDEKKSPAVKGIERKPDERKTPSGK
jgi:hypothetical protein